LSGDVNDCATLLASMTFCSSWRRSAESLPPDIDDDEMP